MPTKISSPSKSRMTESRVAQAVCSVAAIALTGALFDMPYFYFELLRVLVFGVALYVALRFRTLLGLFQLPLFLGAIIFNPIFKIHFTRITWNILDIILATFFVFLSVRIFKYRVKQ